MPARTASDRDRTIGAKLRWARHRAGMTQSALATALGITFQQIQKYEKGSNRIAASMLVHTAQILKVPPADLLDDIWHGDHGPVVSRSTLRILSILQSFPEDVQKPLAEILEAIARIGLHGLSSDGGAMAGSSPAIVSEES